MVTEILKVIFFGIVEALRNAAHFLLRDYYDSAE